MTGIHRWWRRGRGAVVLVVGAAVAVSVLGVGQLVGAAPPEPPSPTSTLDGLRVSTGSPGWLAMDHDMSTNAPGYQMPPAMMPGMPAEGEERLAIPITVANTAGATRPLHPAQEFTLHARPGGPALEPHSTTFGELPRLPAGSAVTGTLFFDLPSAELDESAWIEWRHDGATARLAIGPADSGEPHAHP
jgi:hypothetical protein